MARDGVWMVWQGMWLSSAVLAVLGAFLTNKAVSDSVILNADTYLNAFKNLIGKRTSRNVERKEVIIFTPDYPALYSRLDKLSRDSIDYMAKQKRWIDYLSYWREGGKDIAAEQIVTEQESIVEELENSDRILVLNKLMDYPIIGGHKQLSSHLNQQMYLAIGFFLPLGIPVYLFAIYRRKLLCQDIQTVQKVSEELKDIIINLKDTERV
jgi:lipopolysaccharide export system permease protein